MSLGRSSRFRSLGLAKVKYEKGLSFYASALSITIRQGSKMCCQDPRLGCWQNLDEYGMLKFLRARARKFIHYVVFNKVVHIIHSSPSISFLQTPSNDRL